MDSADCPAGCRVRIRSHHAPAQRHCCRCRPRAQSQYPDWPLLHPAVRHWPSHAGTDPDHNEYPHQWSVYRHPVRSTAVPSRHRHRPVAGHCHAPEDSGCNRPRSRWRILLQSCFGCRGNLLSSRHQAPHDERCRFACYRRLHQN